ncbi:MAG: GNAT family N-acetyltransferase [Candidatus Coatesbacteria bacterium]
MSDAPVRIRTMRARDVGAATRLWRRSSGLGQDTPATVLRFLRRNPGMSFVAFRGRTMVGAVLGGHDGRRGTLWHLAVAPSVRRSGLGTTLTNRVLAAQRAKGIRKTIILVLRDNPKAVSFWRRTGWTAMPVVALSKPGR